jgi:diadenosine tetraphosphate (Ap4A) HIT family hydrolase
LSLLRRQHGRQDVRAQGVVHHVGLHVIAHDLGDAGGISPSSRSVTPRSAGQTLSQARTG